MVKKIVLNDETEIENGSISVAFNQQILVIVPGKDIVQATLTFSNPDKTREMVFLNGVFKTTYKNFTTISSVGVQETANETHVYMTGENTSVEPGYTVSDLYAPKDLLNPETLSQE